MPSDEPEARPKGELRDDVREHYRYLKQRTYCEMCGAEAVASHCKIVCVSCGYRVSCSDPS